MQFHSSESVRVRKPAAPHMDLNSGQIDLTQAAIAGGYVLAALLVATLGTWLLTLDTEWYLRLLGGGIVIACIAFGGATSVVVLLGWFDYRARVAEWHKVSLQDYQRAGGEVYESQRDMVLRSEEFGDVLLAALSAYWRIRAGEETPYSVRELAGPVFLSNHRLGDLTKKKAELMSSRFAELGLVDGRTEGAAGQWKVRSADELIQTVIKRWK